LLLFRVSNFDFVDREYFIKTKYAKGVKEIFYFSRMELEDAAALASQIQKNCITLFLLQIDFVFKSCILNTYS
jgi:hypothetical protein